MGIATFQIRNYQRLPVHCTVYFSNDKLSGTGNLWNLSLTGCRVDGSLRVRSGMRFELLILLPGKRAAIIIQEACVSLTCGREFGLRMITLQPGETVRLEKYINGRMI